MRSQFCFLVLVLLCLFVFFLLFLDNNLTTGNQQTKETLKEVSCFFCK